MKRSFAAANSDSSIPSWSRVFQLHHGVVPNNLWGFPTDQHGESIPSASSTDRLLAIRIVDLTILAKIGCDLVRVRPRSVGAERPAELTTTLIRGVVQSNRELLAGCDPGRSENTDDQVQIVVEPGGYALSVFANTDVPSVTECLVFQYRGL
jgi:hypothetical protein